MSSEYFISFRKNESSRSILTNSTRMPFFKQKRDGSYSVNYNQNVDNDTNINKDSNTAHTTSRSSTHKTNRSSEEHLYGDEKKECIADFENISIEGDRSIEYDSGYISCRSDEISALEEDETITKKFHKDIDEQLHQQESFRTNYANGLSSASNKKYLYSCRHLNNKDAKSVNEIVKKRRCTDVFCFLIIVVCWIITVGIGVWSKINGADPRYIIYPYDYKGNLCGIVNKTIPDFTSGKVTRIPQKLPNQWHIIDHHSYTNYKNGKCVTGCPSKTIFNPIDKTELLCKDEKDVLLSMPQCINYYSNTTRYRMHTNPNYLVACGACMYQIESIQFYDKCITVLNDDVIKYKIESSIIELDASIREYAQKFEDDAIMKTMNKTYLPPSDIQALSFLSIKHHNNKTSFSTFIERFTRDIWTHKYIISTFALAGTTFLSYFLLFIVQRISSSKLITSIFIWILCLITPILLILFGAFCFILSSQENTIQSNDSLQITSYVVWVLSFLILFIIFILRKRVHLAAGVVRTSSKVMTDLPNVMYYPLTQISGYIVFFVVPWYTILLYLATINIPKHLKYVDENVEYDELNSTIQISCFCFMLFTFFWTSEFIIAIGQIALSTYFSKWFFKTTPSNDDKILRVSRHNIDRNDIATEELHRPEDEATNMMKSIYTTMRMHSGTAAYGALIVPLIQGFRTAFIRFYTYLLHLRNKSDFVYVFFCCCWCCISCTERCLKYIHKSAYVQTAMFGYKFNHASKESYNIVVRNNAARMFQVTIFTEVTIIFCKLAIVSSIVISSFFATWLLYCDGDILNATHIIVVIYYPSLVSILILIAIISWYISDMFLEVLSVAISTMIQCHLVEEELHPEGSSYVTYELDKFLNDIDIH